MRELRRQDRKLSEEDARKVLAKAPYGVLATINEDGSPYAVPMAAALVGDTLYMHCGRAGQKLENIQRDPRACFTCVLYAENLPSEFSMEFASCVAEGRVRVVSDEKERMAGMRAVAEKYSAEYLDTPSYERTMRGMPAVVILAMELDGVQGKAPRRRMREE